MLMSDYTISPPDSCSTYTPSSSTLSSHSEESVASASFAVTIAAGNDSPSCTESVAPLNKGCNSPIDESLQGSESFSSTDVNVSTCKVYLLQLETAVADVVAVNDSQNNSRPFKKNCGGRKRLTEFSAVMRARKILLCRNGDLSYKGFPLTISNWKFLSFDKLLDYASTTPVKDSSTMPLGVRYIFTIDGNLVSSLDELEDGMRYFASSTNVFKRRDYTKCGEGCWTTHTARLSDGESRAVGRSTTYSSSDIQRTPTGPEFIPVVPKMIFVVLNSRHPRRMVRMLLSKRTATTLSGVLDRLAVTLEIKNTNIKKLVSNNGLVVNELSDLYKDDIAFIAFEHEKFDQEDLKLTDDEFKFIESTPFAHYSSQHKAKPWIQQRSLSLPPAKSRQLNHLSVPSDQESFEEGSEDVAESLDFYNSSDKESDSTGKRGSLNRFATELTLNKSSSDRTLGNFVNDHVSQLSTGREKGNQLTSTNISEGDISDSDISSCGISWITSGSCAPGSSGSVKLNPENAASLVCNLLFSDQEPPQTSSQICELSDTASMSSAHDLNAVTKPKILAKLNSTPSGTATQGIPVPLLNRYKVGRALITGDFVCLRKCFDKKKKHRVALKVIEKKMLSELQLGQLYSEVKILERIKHSSVLRLVNEIDTPNHLFLMFELIKPGCFGEVGDVVDMITMSTTYTERDVQDIIKSLCLALQYLHSISVAFRNIRPDTVLIYSDDNSTAKKLKLADFGLAADCHSHMSQICGIPIFQAPEMLRGKDYSSKVDNWSAGILMYFMLSGQVPYRGGEACSVNEVIGSMDQNNDILDNKYFDDITDNAKDLLLFMLELEPGLRGKIADILDHPWFDAKQDSTSVDLKKSVMQNIENIKQFLPCHSNNASITALATTAIDRGFGFQLGMAQRQRIRTPSPIPKPGAKIVQKQEGKQEAKQESKKEDVVKKIKPRCVFLPRRCNESSAPENSTKVRAVPNGSGDIHASTTDGPTTVLPDPLENNVNTIKKVCLANHVVI